MNRRRFLLTTASLSSIPILTSATEEAQGEEVIVLENIRRMKVGNSINITKTGPHTYRLTGDIIGKYLK